MPKLFVDIAVPVAVDQLFTYNVPDALQSQIKIGVRVVAPFGNKTVIGFVVNKLKSTTVPRLKDIHDILDPEPIISEEMLKLTHWISEYYFAPWGEVLKAALPQKTFSTSHKIVTLLEIDIEKAFSKTRGAPKQTEVLKLLFEKREISVEHIQKKLFIKNVHSIINELANKGLVNISEQFVTHTIKPKLEKIIHITESSKQKWITFLEASQNNKRISKQISIVQLLNKFPLGSVITVGDLLKQTGATLTSLKSIENAGVLLISEREVNRGIKYESQPDMNQQIILNQHQNEALDNIREAMARNEFQTFLLYGITGSGKTQIYIEAIRKALDDGKSAIVLVPEISLTPQTVSRFQMHFGDKVAVLHSRMSLAERQDVWRLSKSGHYSIVIGPRSAIFSPLKNLKLIVVDEEHESSYKQYDQTPRYNAREVAIMRGVNNNAVVVLGSATPSIESYHNATSGKYKLIELPERVDNAKLPEIEIVDMTIERQIVVEKFRAERKAEFAKDPVAARLSKRKPEFSSISEILKAQIQNRLDKKEGIILLQNRRGFSSLLECLECGYVAMCENCNITLTFHIIKKHLRCHYCGFIKNPPEVCPHCNSTDLSYKGFGTQRVEEELQKFFPAASIVRMDLDTTSQKGSHDKILSRFSRGEIDILLGTQMVAKGLDFSHVTLVGVISADTQMLLPDFRSAERTFQLLTQVAGRAGRSGLMKGEVIIQTYQPKHYTLKHVLTHDYLGFFSEEIKGRVELKYPPFSRMALIEIKGEDESDVIRQSNKLFQLFKNEKTKLIYLGPSEAAISKLNKQYRWHILLKDLKSNDPSGKILREVLTSVMQKFHQSDFKKSKDVKIIVDVDPVGMM
ncbi:MAG: primosomal protein N' [Bacteroidota bacterium]|nr:primosomal protein N' [Bacteroidota bacterium]